MYMQFVLENRHLFYRVWELREFCKARRIGRYALQCPGVNTSTTAE
jgi:hypothetical protein